MWPTGVDGGGSVPSMALHCAATLVLVPVGTVPDDAAGSGAVVVGALAPGADVVEELQRLIARTGPDPGQWLPSFLTPEKSS